MSTAVIRSCTCKHAFQDGMYGLNMRVANTDKTGSTRCTVCGNLAKGFSASTPAKKGK